MMGQAAAEYRQRGVKRRVKLRQAVYPPHTLKRDLEQSSKHPPGADKSSPTPTDATQGIAPQKVKFKLV